MDFVTRPATLDDAHAIQDVVAAGELDYHGRVDTSIDGLIGDLRRPAIDLDRDTVVALTPEGELAGWAWVHQGRLARVDVHPGQRGRGLGTSLLDYVEARAREVGSGRVGQNVSDGDTAAADLLRRRGYEPKATNWLLEIDVTTPPEPSPLPDGVTARPFAAGDEHPVHTVIQDAFDEWQQRRHPYEEWARTTIERDTFAPELSLLAVDGTEVVGALLSLLVDERAEGHIEQLAVRRDFRHRGVARGLLQQAFLGFHRYGRRTGALWTHTDTGALSFYQGLGMVVRRSATHYSTAL